MVHTSSLASDVECSTTQLQFAGSLLFIFYSLFYFIVMSFIIQKQQFTYILKIYLTLSLIPTPPAPCINLKLQELLFCLAFVIFFRRFPLLILTYYLNISPRLFEHFPTFPFIFRSAPSSSSSPLSSKLSK